MKKINLKKNSGITLMTLVITIVVLLILATYATYTGIEAIENTKYTKFVAELKIMQTYVNKWYDECRPTEISTQEQVIEQKFTNESVNAINVANSSTESEIKSKVDKAKDTLLNANISPENYDNFYLLQENQKNALGVEGVTQDILVSVKDRKVVSYLGLKHKNTMYYTLEDLGEFYNVDYEDKNTSTTNNYSPEITNITRIVQIDDNSFKFTVDVKYNAPYVDKGTIFYRKKTDNAEVEADNVNKKWYSTKDNYFLLYENGEYEVKVVDSAGNESIIVNATTDEKYNILNINRESGKTEANAGINRNLLGENDTKNYSYKNPVIPKGFKAVDSDSAKWKYVDTSLKEVAGWNNGLIIEDIYNGNQFVWVPCYLETTGLKNGATVSYEKNTNFAKDSEVENISVTSEQEIEQIAKYGGFYVARYESGITSVSTTQSALENDVNTVVPVSKFGSKIWNYISYENCYTVSQNMINDSDKYGETQSGLITGTQWDTIMKWFQKDGIKVEGTEVKWGSFSDLIFNYTGSQNLSYFIAQIPQLDPLDPDPILPAVENAGDWQNGAFSNANFVNDLSANYYHASGLNEAGIRKNIADLAGNVEEWTSETYGTTENGKRICRGGTASTGRTEMPVTYRHVNDVTTANYDIGFRVVLYVK